METRQRMDAAATRQGGGEDSSYDICRDKLNKLNVERVRDSGGAKLQFRLRICVLLVAFSCVAFPSVLQTRASGDGKNSPSRISGSEEMNLIPDETERRRVGRWGGDTKRTKTDKSQLREADEDITDGQPKAGEETGGFSFRVFGKVQGVSFRKYTKRAAKKFGLVGWVANTDQGTVVGECLRSRQVQGPAKQLAKMEEWLGETGSPKSRIDRLEVTSREEKAELRFSEFIFDRSVHKALA